MLRVGRPLLAALWLEQQEPLGNWGQVEVSPAPASVLC